MGAWPDACEEGWGKLQQQVLRNIPGDWIPREVGMQKTEHGPHSEFLHVRTARHLIPPTRRRRTAYANFPYDDFPRGRWGARNVSRLHVLSRRRS